MDNMDTHNAVTFVMDQEHRKVTLRPFRNEIVKNINLVYYAPAVVMPPHAHDTAQFSTLLSGQSKQCARATNMDNKLGVAEYKPIDFNHSNEIGPHGALMLSVNINAESDAFTEEFGQVNWNLSRVSYTQHLWKVLLGLMFQPQKHKTVNLEELILGLLSSAFPYSKVKTAPDWLLLAEQALNDSEMSIDEIAKSVGVHRVHLCRVFQTHFGVSVSHYRQRIAIQKGLCAMINSGQNIARSGVEAGFADQSHFTRVLKQHFGVTPSRFKSLFSQ